MTPRPMVLVLLLIILVVTYQSEWKQQLGHELDVVPDASQKQRRLIKREESVKEKIILSQEKNIQRLNELVRDLQQQLVLCQSSNMTDNARISATDFVSDVEEKHTVDG